MEATATWRAGLERFTFPSGSKPYFVLDLANDLPESFAGGELDIDPVKGRITISGYWGSRYTYWLRFECRGSSFFLALDLNYTITRLSLATIS